MTLELKYSGDLGERNYYMLLNGKSFLLNDEPTLGSPDDAYAARRKANEIVKREVADLATVIGLQQHILLMRFKFSGAQ